MVRELFEFSRVRELFAGAQYSRNLYFKHEIIYIFWNLLLMYVLLHYELKCNLFRTLKSLISFAIFHALQKSIVPLRQQLKDTMN